MKSKVPKTYEDRVSTTFVSMVIIIIIHNVWRVMPPRQGTIVHSAGQNHG